MNTAAIARVAARAGLLATGAVLLAGCAGPSGPPSTAATAPSCPAGTGAHVGVCIETELRPAPSGWREANLACLTEGRRVPTFAELQTFLPTSGADPANLEWHNLRYRVGTEELAGLVAGNGQVEVVRSGEVEDHRCVAMTDGA